MEPIALATFALVFAIIVGPYWLFVLRPETQGGQAIKARLSAPRTMRITRGLLKSKERLSSVTALETALQRWGSVTTPVGSLIAKAGVRMTVGTLILSSVFLTVLTTAIAARLLPYAALGLVLGAMIGALPFLYVRFKASQRLAKFEEQFPEALDLMARALRAGHALPTALQMVADEVADPVGSEFRVLFDQQNFGMSLPDALKGFGSRVPILDARFFVTAVLTQREMGGNLSEVLDKLAAVTRERFKVKRHVRAVSAHGRITGVVLSLLPPVVAAVLFVLSPQHIGLLVQDPLGINMIVMAVVLQTIGVVIIRRIVNVEY